MSESLIPKRIGRHSRPGGIVIHVRAVPSCRLVDVHSLGPDRPVAFEHVAFELGEDEDGVLFVPYDGDSGKLIRPYPTKAERFMQLATIVGVVAVLLLNLIIAVALFPDTRFVINALCVALVAPMAVHKWRRARRFRATAEGPVQEYGTADAALPTEPEPNPDDPAN